MNRHHDTYHKPKRERLTARSKIVSILTQEILSNSSAQSFKIGSEYQMCRRFGVSRVTVRLALDDLKHRGLVYPKHGVGTFAYGHSTRNPRHIAIVLNPDHAFSASTFTEFFRGVHAFAAQHRFAELIIDSSITDWPLLYASHLCGVILFGPVMTEHDIASLQSYDLPFVLVAAHHESPPASSASPGELSLSGSTAECATNSINAYQTGMKAAQALLQLDRHISA